jgi:hypothetical protein
VTLRDSRCLKEARTVEFIFVSDGVRVAVEGGREAAGDRYVTIGGGPDGT